MPPTTYKVIAVLQTYFLKLGEMLSIDRYTHVGCVLVVPHFFLVFPFEFFF